MRPSSGTLVLLEGVDALRRTPDDLTCHVPMRRLRKGLETGKVLAMHLARPLGQTRKFPDRIERARQFVDELREHLSPVFAKGAQFKGQTRAVRGPGAKKDKCHLLILFQADYLLVAHALAFSEEGGLRPQLPVGPFNSAC